MNSNRSRYLHRCVSESSQTKDYVCMCMCVCVCYPHIELINIDCLMCIMLKQNQSEIIGKNI
jgi:hypothetical protein